MATESSRISLKSTTTPESENLGLDLEDFRVTLKSNGSNGSSVGRYHALHSTLSQADGDDIHDDEIAHFGPGIDMASSQTSSSRTSRRHAPSSPSPRQHFLDIPFIPHDYTESTRGEYESCKLRYGTWKQDLVDLVIDEKEYNETDKKQPDGILDWPDLTLSDPIPTLRFVSPSAQVRTQEILSLLLSANIVDSASFPMYMEASYIEIVLEAEHLSADKERGSILVNAWLLFLLEVNKVQSLIFATAIFTRLVKTKGLLSPSTTTQQLTRWVESEWYSWDILGSWPPSLQPSVWTSNAKSNRALEAWKESQQIKPGRDSESAGPMTHHQAPEENNATAGDSDGRNSGTRPTERDEATNEHRSEDKTSDHGSPTLPLHGGEQPGEDGETGRLTNSIPLAALGKDPTHTPPPKVLATDLLEPQFVQLAKDESAAIKSTKVDVRPQKGDIIQVTQFGRRLQKQETGARQTSVTRSLPLFKDNLFELYFVTSYFLIIHRNDDAATAIPIISRVEWDSRMDLLPETRSKGKARNLTAMLDDGYHHLYEFNLDFMRPQSLSWEMPMRKVGNLVDHHQHGNGLKIVRDSVQKEFDSGVNHKRVSIKMERPVDKPPPRWWRMIPFL